MRRNCGIRLTQSSAGDQWVSPDGRIGPPLRLCEYLLGRAVSEHLVFRRVEGGFDVFRTYGGVETHIDVLKIGRVTRSKAGEEERRRFVEEARRTAPDLSGVKKIWQTLEWLSTDVSFAGRQVVGGTVRLW